MIEEMLRDVVARRPHGTAIAFGDRRISYRELAAQISGLSEGLNRLGIGAGDCVLIVLPNCPEFVVGYFATAGLRATVQALNPQLKEQEFLVQLKECAPAVIITSAAQGPLFDRLAAAAGSAPIVIPVGESASSRPTFDDIVRTGGEEPVARERYDGQWVFTYSSGSTGEPKRIGRSQANQVAEGDNIMSTAGITTDDVILCPVPLFHALGQFCCMIVAIRAGATLVLLEPGGDTASEEMSHALDLGRIIELIREHRVTILPAVPYLLGALADWPADQAADLSSVRLCLSGSNFLSPQIRERFLARFGVPIRQTYGSSEAGSVSWDCDPDSVAPASVGRPLHGVTVEILDEDGRALPPDSVGEIAVTSGSVMTGYAGQGQDAAHSPGDRYLTGDLGRIGEDGRLYLTGRKRILVDTGGHKVNPVEVESVLEAHPAVAAAAVVGVPLRGGGDLLVAAVIPLGKPPADELRAYCRERLADYKVPGRIEFVEDIPRSPLGKIRRSHLAALLATVGDESGEDRGLRRIWQELDLAARLPVIAGHLLRRTAEITGVGPDSVDRTAPLRSLGLDSLAALRLKMAIQDDLHRSVRLPDLLGAATIDSLSFQLAQDTEDSVAPLVAGGRSVGEFPLSYNQLSIWHADQVAPENAAYNQSFAARVTSGCDLQALRGTFQALVNRHPVLRTTFVVRDGRPFQQVADRAPVDFEVIDVPSDWEPESEELSAEAFRPFDLAAEHPLRVRLYAGAAGGPVLLLTLHHIVTDFWSLVTMLQDIETIYTVEASGGEIYWPSLPYSYTDYGRWLAEVVEGPAGEQDWAYWRERLGETPPALDLPVDRQRPVVQSRLGDTYFHDMAPDFVGSLQSFARAQGSTVYTVMLAAFHVFLHAYTAEQDIALAAITTSRQRHEFRDVLGYFVNPIVCRTRVEPERTFPDLLDIVQQNLLTGLDHQLLPFETIVERLGLKRDRSRAPLVEVAFGQNKAHDAGMLSVSRFLSGGSGHHLRLGSLGLESIALRQRGVVYDFSGAVYEAGESISIAWEYNTDLFEAETVERMAAEFEQMLRALLDHPGQPIGRIDVARGDDRRRLLAASRGTHLPVAPSSVPELFAEQVRLRPTATAVVAGADRLTYQQLAERAARLAGLIRGTGAASGSRAAVWLPPSVDLAVAGLGALTARTVCDPIAADSPAYMVRSAVTDGGAQLLITTVAGRDRLGAVGVPVVCTDGAEPGAAAGADPAVLPDAPALVLRTSGVTGPPRARLLDHHALAGWAVWTREQYGPMGDVLVHDALRPDRVLARLLAVTAVGGTAVLTAAGETPEELAEFLVSGRGFDLVTVTAAELGLMLPVLAESGRRPQVATLAVTGDVLPGRLVREWRRLAGATRMVHEYGGAETALTVSAHDIPADFTADGPVPVGRPVPGVDCYVLDRSGRLCPTGVPGELHVSVAAVTWPADGEALPVERLVADPFAGDPAAPQLYRTGDVGYYQRNGDVVVLGRADQLTYVRGYRVYLGQVEAALMCWPAIAAALVTADDGNGEQRLVAQVVVQEDGPGGRPTPAALRDGLRHALPEYLVPAEIVIVDRLPVAGNGKRARTGPAAATAQSEGSGEAEHTEPSTPVEIRLAAIWEETLGVAKVKPNDDYFDLDGDSITSMRIVSRAAEAGIRITPRQLFTYPTLRELAAVAELVDVEQPASAEPPTAGDVVPPAPVQQWFFELELTDPDHWNQAILLKTREPLDRTVLREALLAVAGHHPAFRFRYSRTSTGWRQTADLAGEAVRVMEHDAVLGSPQSGSGRFEDIATEAHASLDLEAGPVFAAVIAPDDTGDGQLLLLLAHHLVIDFVSWQIVTDDLTRAYEQLRAGQEVRLPVTTTSFARWTSLLHDHASSPAVLAELDHWAGPVGREREQPPATSEQRHARTVTAALSEADTTALLDSSADRDSARVQDIVLAAVAHTVANWTGEHRVQIDIEGHGREELFEDVDLTRTVGWFTAMYPLLFEFEPGLGPAEAFRTVRDALRRVPVGGMGYGLLRYAATDPVVRERMATVPRSTVNFNYLGRMGELLDGNGRLPEGRQLFTAVPLAEGGDRSPANVRPYPLEISAMLASGRLSVRVVYSEQQHQRASVEDLVTQVLERTTAIAAALPTDARQTPPTRPRRAGI